MSRLGRKEKWEKIGDKNKGEGDKTVKVGEEKGNGEERKTAKTEGWGDEIAKNGEKREMERIGRKPSRVEWKGKWGEKEEGKVKEGEMKLLSFGRIGIDLSPIEEGGG